MSEPSDIGSDPSPPPNYVLLAVGVLLLLVPLAFVALFPREFAIVQFYLRVIAALGGALVGATLPGFLHVKVPFARAGGALGVFLITRR